jgi:hypothetical protein
VTDRPEPVRCGKIVNGRPCNGIVAAPATGKEITIVRRVLHSQEADPCNDVLACGRCGNLYEVRTQEAAA